MITSRLISLAFGFSIVSLAFAIDYLIDGQPGFGFSQYVILVYGLTWILVAYLIPSRRPLTADWARLLLLIIGGIGLAIGLHLHLFLDGHAPGFRLAKLTTLTLSATLVIFAIFVTNNHGILFLRLCRYLIRICCHLLRQIIQVALIIKVLLLYSRRTLINTAVFVVAVTLCLGSLELLIRNELFAPSYWVAVKHQELDRHIDQENIIISRSNRHGFSDRNRTFTKPHGIVRIAVLGDSAIFGDGVPNDVIWSHRLEEKILDHYEKFELLSWGRNGWSTLDQLDFLIKEGINYQIDHLLIAWVTNDPDLGDKPQRYLAWQDNDLFSPVRFLFPNVFSYLTSEINNVLLRYIYTDYGYGKWEQSLYTDNNLQRYSLVLKDLRDYCKANNIDLTIVLAPNNYSSWFQTVHDLVIPIFESLSIPHFDLYPYIKDQLGHLPIEDLNANPGDGHPGEKVTAVVSNEVFNYLERVHILF